MFCLCFTVCSHAWLVMWVLGSEFESSWCKDSTPLTEPSFQPLTDSFSKVSFWFFTFVHVLQRWDVCRFFLFVVLGVYHELEEFPIWKFNTVMLWCFLWGFFFFFSGFSLWGLLLNLLNFLTIPLFLLLLLSHLIFLSVFILFWVIEACLIPLNHFSHLSLSSS